MTLLKRIAVINDISGFGRCSLTAAIPVISAMGIECCPLPTAVLSNQTAYDSYYSADCTEHLLPIIKEWRKLGARFDAVLTGFIACEKQADIISDFFDSFKDSGTLLAVDPIMADDGALYDSYSLALCEKVKSLAKKACLITPNLSELCLLCNTDYNAEFSKEPGEESLKKAEKLARSLLSDTLKTVIVTGVRSGGFIHNLAVEKGFTHISKSRIFGATYSGTGDIFTSIVCGEMVKGKSVEYAVSFAAAFLEKAIEDTYLNETGDPNDGINFQKYLGALTYE